MSVSHPTRTVGILLVTAIAALALTSSYWQFQHRAPPTQQDPYGNRRQAMVRQQIEARGITDSATIAALRTVRRHLFVPPDRVGEAYDDGPIPIGYGQTISQPYIVALMTELLGVGPGDRVLEIGTGSGYQAAILADMVDSVFTIEIIEELAHASRDRLNRLRYGNVQVRHADGYHGWPEHAPFDGIVVTAAAEHIPPPLVDQLKEGGRMIIPVGHPFFVQNLVLVEKRDGSISTRSVIPVRFVPFTRSQ